mgnify:CR=1 FL=1
MESDIQNFKLADLLSVEKLTDLGLNIIAAIAIVIVTFWLAKWVRNRIVKAGRKYEELDATLFSFLSRVAYFVVLIFGLTIVLNKFGIQTTSIITMLGAAGLAVGLALQGALSNFASGVLLILFRPFKLGDFISVGGESGTVKEISIFVTDLATPDNVQIIVPNSQVWGSSITNYSAYDTRRVDFVFGVSYGTDLKKAQQVITDLIAQDARVHSDPEPFVKVGTLNDSSVDFTVRIWCDAPDYWDVKFDMTRAVKDAFDAKGIDIPFPTTTIVKAD